VALQEAISGLVAGRTLLVVAHRLSTVAGADQILVLDDGRIVERGRHAGLLASQGLYAQLWAAFTGTGTPSTLPGPRVTGLELEPEREAVR
jgi:ABC-type multidrug transport system fused ATPase/permease subunit